ncbi:hypothetical protein PMIN06_006729 [Paraphaeosphaeria minitans]
MYHTITASGKCGIANSSRPPYESSSQVLASDATLVDDEALEIDLDEEGDRLNGE